MHHQGKKLKNLIRDKGFKQEEFAKNMGISRNYLLMILKEPIVNNMYLSRALAILNMSQPDFDKLSDKEEIKSNGDMETKYNNLKADYDRLLANYERIEKLVVMLEGQLQHGRIESKGKSRQA